MTTTDDKTKDQLEIIDEIVKKKKKKKKRAEKALPGVFSTEEDEDLDEAPAVPMA